MPLRGRRVPPPLPGVRMTWSRHYPRGEATMTCEASGADLHAAINDLIGTTTYAPGLGGLIGKGLNARIHGQKYDASLWDYAQATSLDDLAAMGVGQVVTNAGHSVTVHVAGEIVSGSPTVHQASEAINQGLDTRAGCSED